MGGKRVIKAIETHWHGYRFRSRLEARWAVFFEELGIRWEYEPEGFQTRAGWYLPDFWLPELGVWAEVKPDSNRKKVDKKDRDKMVFFVLDSRQPLLILDGTPAPKVYKMISPSLLCWDGCEYNCDPFGDDECDAGGDACYSCVSKGIAKPSTQMQRVCWYPKYLPPQNHDGEPGLYWQPYGGEEGDTSISAINAARSARFEHGEKPRVRV